MSLSHNTRELLVTLIQIGTSGPSVVPNIVNLDLTVIVSSLVELYLLLTPGVVLHIAHSRRLVVTILPEVVHPVDLPQPGPNLSPGIAVNILEGVKGTSGPANIASGFVPSTTDDYPLPHPDTRKSSLFGGLITVVTVCSVYVSE